MKKNALPVIEGHQGPRVQVDGKTYDYFDGCSYFGLSGDRRLIQAANRAMRTYGFTTMISRHVAVPALLEVEAAACRFFNSEAALYHPTGYMGNALILRGLDDEYDRIFMDETSHYSILDAVMLTRKPVVTFRHRSPEDLRHQLQRRLRPGQRPLVITDGCFPISGQLPPLADYDAVLRKYPKYRMVVDDSHVTGVIGKKGRGSLEWFGLQGDHLHTSGTLSKALGVHGGIIPGSRDFVSRVRKFAGAATPCAVPVAGAAVAALDLLREHPELRKKLWADVAYAKNGLRSLGFDIPDTPVPIICLHAHPAGNPRDLRAHLFAKEILCQYREEGSYTSVPRNGSNRIVIMATHSRAQIDRLIAAVAEYLVLQ